MDWSISFHPLQIRNLSQENKIKANWGEINLKLLAAQVRLIWWELGESIRIITPLNQQSTARKFPLRSHATTISPQFSFDPFVQIRRKKFVIMGVGKTFFIRYDKTSMYISNFVFIKVGADWPPFGEEFVLFFELLGEANLSTAYWNPREELFLGSKPQSKWLTSEF